ncbi:hypothetical protein HDU97_007168 [Phlyctochytrium planicorne]|nr:hypothetical protein HDU97_007168 [Phlyctochytrium planicorne]
MNSDIPLPIETIQNILRWTEDYAVSIKIESILADVPRLFPPKETAFEGFEISEFPISAVLTETCTLLPNDIDPSTVSLSVIAWLVKFRPDIFWRREGHLVRQFAAKGRLNALMLIGSNTHARSQAFDWGEIDEAARSRNLDLLRYLHETVAVPFTISTLAKAARSGNLDMVKYLHRLESECATTALNEAFCSGNADVVKYVLENFSEQTSDIPWFESLKTTFPDLEDLIIKTKPRFINGSLMKAAGDGDLDRLIQLFSVLGSTKPEPAVLRCAVATGQMNIVKYLVESQGAEIDVVTLSEAVEMGDFGMFRYLYEKNPNLPGSLAFGTACRNGRLEIVKHIHETHPKSCQHTKPGPLDFMVLLCYNQCTNPVKNGHVNVLKYLKENCAKYKATEVLKEAAMHEQVEILEYLAPEINLHSIMATAARKGHLDLVHLIFSQWQSKEIDFETIDAAAETESSLQAIKFLYATGKFDFTEKALIAAASTGHLKTLKYLLTEKPDLSILSSLTAALIHWRPLVFSFLDRHLTASQRKLWNPASCLKEAFHKFNMKAIRYIVKRDPNTALLSDSIQQTLEMDDDNGWHEHDFSTLFECLVSDPICKGAITDRELFVNRAVDARAWDCVRILMKDPSTLKIVPDMLDSSEGRIFRYLTQ